MIVAKYLTDFFLTVGISLLYLRIFKLSKDLKKAIK
jgi:hypothetical protein